MSGPDRTTSPAPAPADPPSAGPGQAWGGPGEEYRLARIAPGAPVRGPGASRAAPVAGRPGPDAVAPVWDVPRRRRSVPWFEIVLTTLGVAGVAVTVVGYALTGGIATTAMMSALALGPLLVVLAVLSFIDRWEPEPLWGRIVALVWGAGVATLAASIVNTAMLMDAVRSSGDYRGATVTVAVLVAPVVEETLKGLGVLLIVWWRRSGINSVLDGVVYAGWAGAGFAFVENVQYFLQAHGSGGTVLGATLLLRGVLSPFVHPMATSFTGMALALAVTRTRSQWSWVWIGSLGLAAAVAVHGLWNLLSTVAAVTWLGWYLAVEVPLFAVWVIGLLVASSREARRIARGLHPYVRTGWLLPAEVPMVVDRGGRRAARRWARAGGRSSAAAMRTFQTSAATLGLDQVIMTRIGPVPERIAHDRRLLADLGRAREEFLRAVRAAGAGAQTAGGPR